jgi:hypothetical protein
VLEKHLKKEIAAIALAALALASFQLSGTPAYSEGQDSFGIEKIYQTAAGGNEWYVNMNDPRDDPNFRNLGNIDFDKNSDGSWQVSAGQIRMEAWSPSNEKWLNIEITEYAKIESGSNELLQMYSRGGHHTSRDECLGSAYKARLYGNGVAAWNKEITHPAYAGNRGSAQVTNEPLEDRWIGFKAVIYNFVEDGNTYVRLESYIDDDVTDEDGTLVVKNNWKLASVYEDRGGWATSNSDFNSSCGRDRDEILTMPGGTSAQNIAAFRSDDLTWSFKYLSVREIDPSAQPAQEEQETEPVDDEADDSDDSGILCETDYCDVIAIKHIENDGSITEINSVDLNLKKSTLRSSGMITVTIVQGSHVLARDEISSSGISTTYTAARAEFSTPVNIEGSSFDIVVAYEGSGSVQASSFVVG